MKPNANFLLVDDDPIFLLVTEKIVRALGCQRITPANGGVEGLRAIRESAEQFDYIVLDLNMPDLDGLTFLKTAGAEGFRGEIIISSGEAESVLRSARMMAELWGARVLGSIKKPLTVDSLRDMLARRSSHKPQLPARIGVADTASLAELELIPYYQTQHDAFSRSITGLESLIRVRSADGQIHGPGKLFGSIDSHSQMVVTSIAIAAKVLDDALAWKSDGVQYRIAINLDAKVAEEPEVVATLVAMVAARNIDPRQITFELTETALPSDVAGLMESLTRLRMAGFGVSLDDFGTGASNFEMLRLCPFTELKLDGSVIRASMTEPIARHFLESSVKMARELDIDVVAEGVESVAQLDLVQKYGIPTVQGFLLSVPVSAGQISRPLTAQRHRLTA